MAARPSKATWLVFAFSALVGPLWGLAFAASFFEGDLGSTSFGRFNWYLSFSIVSLLITVGCLHLVRQSTWPMTALLGPIAWFVGAMFVGCFWLLDSAGIIAGGIAAVTYWWFTIGAGATHMLALKALDARLRHVPGRRAPHA